MGDVLCPSCKIPMILRNSKFNKGKWYGCRNFPKCRVTMTLNQDGSILGTAADQKLKELRKKAHKTAEKIWGIWNSPGCQKGKMYAWMKENTKAGHIGHMDKNEVNEVIIKMEEVLRKEGN